MGTYDRYHKMALRLLGVNGLGADITIKRKTTPTFDPTTGQTSEGTPTTLAMSGVRINFKQYLVNGETVKDQDVLFYITPTTKTGNVVAEIKQSDTVTFDSALYAIVDVKPWNFNGVVIGYKVHSRISS